VQRGQPSAPWVVDLAAGLAADGKQVGGLRGRTLTTTNLLRFDVSGENLHEDEVRIPAVTFRLGAVQGEMVDLVKKLCEPLFVIFDYAVIPDDTYSEIITEFVDRKARQLSQKPT
jgi:hypothetical protein